MSMDLNSWKYKEGAALCTTPRSRQGLIPGQTSDGSQAADKEWSKVMSGQIKGSMVSGNPAFRGKASYGGSGGGMGDPDCAGDFRAAFFRVPDAEIKGD